MRFLFLLSLIFFSIATSGMCKEIKGIGLALGKFIVINGIASQSVSISNNLKKNLTRVEIECGFFQADKLVASENSFVKNLDAGETGYTDVLALNSSEAETAKCRTVSVE